MKKYFVASLLLILFSCSETNLNVDVSQVNIDAPKLKRLDRDLFQMSSEKFKDQSNKISSEYGPVYSKYLMNPLRVNGIEDSLYEKSILNFIHDKDVLKAQKNIQAIYTDLKVDEIQQSIFDCMKHFNYYFPNRRLPKQMVYCVTGWNYAFAYVDESFLIGLDMYMGASSEFYSMLAYPNYQVRKMSSDYILPDLARGWILTEFDNSEAENTLLHHSIFYGKLFYATNALLPSSHDSLLIGYTGKQLEYCKQYEKKLWGYFAEKNRLFDNNLELVRELTSDGPFTGSISKDCPPRIAMWMGWQIVRSYMKNNKEVSLEELMMEKNASKILTKSKYRP